MIYTPLTNKAMKLAYNAHHGQVDKAGMPYIFHPYHLAEQIIAHNSDESRLAGCEGITEERYKKMLIRQENINDYENVYQLIKEAFATAEHADGNEQDLVAALRKSDAFVPELSLVAEIDGKLAGHILFTKAKVGEREILALAPLAVKPEYQKQGVGTALIGEGHRLAGKLGYEYSIVLGSEVYYPRFGYIPAVELGVTLPEGFPSENFMAVKLKEEAEVLKGSMIYAREFGI